MNRRRVYGVVASVLLAFVGVLILVSAVSSARDQQLADSDPVEVYVATDPIPKGTAVADLADLAALKKVPRSLEATGAVTDLGRLDPLAITAVDIVPGEQIVTSRLVSPTDLGRSKIPEGLQEVAIALPAQRALAGLLVPGDRVGVIFAFEGSTLGGTGASTHLTLQQILVTGVQLGKTDAETRAQTQANGTATSQATPTSDVVVTVAVTAPQAEQLAFAAEFGSVWLTRQNADTSATGSVVVTPQNVYSGSSGR